MTLNYVTIVILIVKSNIVKIKEINLIEPENSIKEINLHEINTISEDNNDKQYLEFETIGDIRQIGDTNYCNSLL